MNMNMNMNMNMHANLVMLVIMIASGFLSTMNMWATNINDVRFSLNDVYMVLLMSGWMFLFTGMYFKQVLTTLFGFILVLINIWCIRTQFMICKKQYLLGMIPHHSMAILMSEKLLEKERKASKSIEDTDFKKFLQTIISTQTNEIKYMKHELKTKY